MAHYFTPKLNKWRFICACNCLNILYISMSIRTAQPFLQTLQDEDCWKLTASLNRMLLEVYVDDDNLLSILKCQHYTHTSVSSHQEALSVRTDAVFSRVSWRCILHYWGEHRRNRFVQFTEDFRWNNLLALFILRTSISQNSHIIVFGIFSKNAYGLQIIIVVNVLLSNGWVFTFQYLALPCIVQRYILVIRGMWNQCQLGNNCQFVQATR